MNNQQQIFYKNSKHMKETKDSSVACVITSPLYFNFKDYGNGVEIKEMIGGKNDSYDSYISDILEVFKECHEKLIPNGKLCINIPTIE